MMGCGHRECEEVRAQRLDLLSVESLEFFSRICVLSCALSLEAGESEVTGLHIRSALELLIEQQEECRLFRPSEFSGPSIDELMARLDWELGQVLDG